MRNKVRQERQLKRWTQEELAKLIGVSRQTVNALESEKYVPSTILSLKIARLFGKAVEEIFVLEAGD